MPRNMVVLPKADFAGRTACGGAHMPNASGECRRRAGRGSEAERGAVAWPDSLERNAGCGNSDGARRSAVDPADNDAEGRMQFAQLFLGRLRIVLPEVPDLVTEGALLRRKQ
jgi:hypothetical protein